MKTRFSGNVERLRNEIYLTQTDIDGIEQSIDELDRRESSKIYQTGVALSERQKIILKRIENVEDDIRSFKEKIREILLLNPDDTIDTVALSAEFDSYLDRSSLRLIDFRQKITEYTVQTLSTITLNKTRENFFTDSDRRYRSEESVGMEISSFLQDSQLSLNDTGYIISDDQSKILRSDNVYKNASDVDGSTSFYGAYIDTTNQAYLTDKGFYPNGNTGVTKNLGTMTGDERLIMFSSEQRLYGIIRKKEIRAIAPHASGLYDTHFVYDNIVDGKEVEFVDAGVFDYYNAGIYYRRIIVITNKHVMISNTSFNKATATLDSVRDCFNRGFVKYENNGYIRCSSQIVGGVTGTYYLHISSMSGVRRVDMKTMVETFYPALAVRVFSHMGDWIEIDQLGNAQVYNYLGGLIVSGLVVNVVDFNRICLNTTALVIFNGSRYVRYDELNVLYYPCVVTTDSDRRVFCGVKVISGIDFRLFIEIDGVVVHERDYIATISGTNIHIKSEFVMYGNRLCFIVSDTSSSWWIFWMDLPSDLSTVNKTAPMSLKLLGLPTTDRMYFSTGLMYLRSGSTLKTYSIDEYLNGSTSIYDMTPYENHINFSRIQPSDETYPFVDFPDANVGRINARFFGRKTNYYFISANKDAIYRIRGQHGMVKKIKNVIWSSTPFYILLGMIGDMVYCIGRNSTATLFYAAVPDYDIVLDSPKPLYVTSDGVYQLVEMKSAKKIFSFEKREFSESIKTEGSLRVSIVDENLFHKKSSLSKGVPRHETLIFGEKTGLLFMKKAVQSSGIKLSQGYPVNAVNSDEILVSDDFKGSIITRETFTSSEPVVEEFIVHTPTPDTVRLSLMNRRLATFPVVSNLKLGGEEQIGRYLQPSNTSQSIDSGVNLIGPRSNTQITAPKLRSNLHLDMNYYRNRRVYDKTDLLDTVTPSAIPIVYHILRGNGFTIKGAHVYDDGVRKQFIGTPTMRNHTLVNVGIERSRPVSKVLIITPSRGASGVDLQYSLDTPLGVESFILPYLPNVIQVYRSKQRWRSFIPSLVMKDNTIVVDKDFFETFDHEFSLSYGHMELDDTLPEVVVPDSFFYQNNNEGRITVTGQGFSIVILQDLDQKSIPVYGLEAYGDAKYS